MYNQQAANPPNSFKRHKTLNPSVLTGVYSPALERLKTTGEMYQHQQRKNYFQAWLEHKRSFLTIHCWFKSFSISIFNWLKVF